MWVFTNRDNLTTNDDNISQGMLSLEKFLFILMGWLLRSRPIFIGINSLRGIIELFQAFYQFSQIRRMPFNFGRRALTKG